jgi:hypothetical protein
MISGVALDIAWFGRPIIVLAHTPPAPRAWREGSRVLYLRLAPSVLTGAVGRWPYSTVPAGAGETTP